MITLIRKQQIIMGHLEGESDRKIVSRLHLIRDTMKRCAKKEPKTYPGVMA